MHRAFACGTDCGFWFATITLSAQAHSGADNPAQVPVVLVMAINLGPYPSFKTPGAYWALQGAQEQTTLQMARFVLDNPHDREHVYRALVTADALTIGF